MKRNFNPILRLNTVSTILSVLIFWLSFVNSAQAIPSFTRQTGMACTACHTQAFGPNLTPYGRAFKLNAYTWGSNDSLLSRISGSVQGSLTNTKKDDPSFSNNSIALDQASIFFGGRVVDQMGAMLQLTYAGVGNTFYFDNTDIRISDETSIFDQSVIYGVSFNNNPTVQDLWNTTPAWGYPYVGSALAATPSAAPIISNVGGQVGGATLYSMIADTVMLEAGAYTSFAKGVQRGMGQWDTSNPNYSANSGSIKINGGAPYWRIALQKEWQGNYVSLGHFGFRADVQPNVTVPGNDRYTDLGMDFNYQYLANTKHIVEAKASYIREQQQLFSTYYNLGGATQLNQQLGFLGLNSSYTYDQTYTLALGYNHIYGNSDTILYTSSINAKPNSEYFTFELDYVPFGKKATTGLASYLNLRFAAQYVAYTLFNGAINNYDGVSGRNANDNNTFYFNSWLVF